MTTGFAPVYTWLQFIPPRREQPGMIEHPNRDQWLAMDDAALVASCRIDRHRSSGPGGQHANKTSSAVRLRHGSTGLAVVAEEQRSQHANKVRAIKRLRIAIALHVRQPIDDAWQPPDALRQCVTKAGRIEISRKNPDYSRVVAVVLDLLAAHRGALRDTADSLGITTSQLSRFLTSDGKLLDAANIIRHDAGQHPLTRRP